MTLLTARCAGCGTRGPVLCRTCRFALISQSPIDGPDGVIVASSYTGRVRDVLLGCKFQNRRGVAAHLGGVLARRLRKQPALLARVDTVTWAPTTNTHRRRRGFDQSELLARSVAAHLGLPCRRLLEREGSGAQTGRARRERLDPLSRPRFRAHPLIAGHGVLVIDDIVTTGATLAAARAALGDAGAETFTAAVAATPGCLVPVQRVA